MNSTNIGALMTCFVLALPTPGWTQDATKDKTAPQVAKPTSPKDVVKSLVGSWEGTCRTWFTPDKLADEWVRLPNSNAIFTGRTPLACMMAGGLLAMQTVRKLLDARRGGV